MTNKVGIGIEAQLDAGSIQQSLNEIEQKLNAFGKNVAQANKVQFTPVSIRSVDDLKKMTKAAEEYLKVSDTIRRRAKDTDQSNRKVYEMDFDAMFPSRTARSAQLMRAGRRLFGEGAFSARPGEGPPSDRRQWSWFGTMAGQVAQAGLRSAGSAGGVAANALGTGMSAGFGAGLMGLLGGMLALGASKIIGSITEKIGEAEDNAIAMDRLKRSLGDVNVSFDALKAAVHGGADMMRITYGEAGKLAQQFVKLGNVSGDQYKSLQDELGVGVGMARAYGLDPSQGVGMLGQMRGLGITSNTQESRRFALLIGETIGKSNAFAKSEEVMDAIASFASAQTRNNMGRANVEGYAGMFSALVGSGIPGMDPSGAASLLGKVNASLSAGGSKGEASQFFTALIGKRMGLDAIQTQIMREGGAFATNDTMFGEGSAAARYGISGPKGDKTFLQESLAGLRKQYGNNKGLLAQATANHLGIGINQAMGLLSVNPNQIGEMQKYADMGTLSNTGFANLSKALYGSADDRQALAQSFAGRADVKQEDKDALAAAMKGSVETQRETLARLTAQYDQERTTGGDIRDAKNALDNIKTNLADKLVPVMQDMREGILYLAGDRKKTGVDVLKEIAEKGSQFRSSQIEAQYSATDKQQRVAQMRSQLDAMPSEGRLRDRLRAGIITRDEYDKQMRERTRLETQIDLVSTDIKDLMHEKKRLLEQENERLKREQQAIIDSANAQAQIGAAAGDAGIIRAGFFMGGQNGSPMFGGGMGGGGGGMGNLPTGKPGSRNAAMAFFMKKGWTREQSAGIVANLIAESNMKPGAVGDGKRAYGIAQWHPDRQADFQRWAGKSIRGSSVEEQMGFVHFELTQGKEQDAGRRLSRARTAGAAGEIVSRYYERPYHKDAEARKRAAMASKIASTPISKEAVPARGDNSRQQVVVDAKPIEVIHRNERGDVLRTETLNTNVRRATPFGTNTYV